MSATIVLDWYEFKKEERKRSKKRPPNDPDPVLFLVLAIFWNIPLSGLLVFAMDVVALLRGIENLSISYISFITLYVSSIALLFLLVYFLEKHSICLGKEELKEFLRKWGELIDIPFINFAVIGIGIVLFTLYSVFFEGGSELSVRTGYISVIFSFFIAYDTTRFILKKKEDQPNDKDIAN